MAKWRSASPSLALTLPTTGTYVVQVYQMRAQARRNEKAPHSLTVAIR